MKKVCCIIALAAFSLSTVFAYADVPKTAFAADTVKKVKPKHVKVKKHKMKMKDTSSTTKM
jgi:hypothetical protein